MLTVMTTSVVLVLVAVFIHLTVLQRMVRALPRISGPRGPRVAYLVLVAIVAHMLEIGVFAAGYEFLSRAGEHGDLVGSGGTVSGWSQHTYFSATVYTTVGFGDITAVGQMRLLTAVEALTGLVLVTWTASAIFLVMQREWAEARAREDG